MAESSPTEQEHISLDMVAENERIRLSPSAALSGNGIRRRLEERPGYRQNFALDADRILHSRAYTRYIDKTQVFCLIENDHITHRVLHVQLVARIARTIGRFLHLNEELVEASALGHDIGHPPFGHAGENFLSAICVAHGLPHFQHNIQSVRALDRLEKKGLGWNLTLQTLDGILCHDGEVRSDRIGPAPLDNFAAFDAKLEQKSTHLETNLQPMTLEGCVVRLADTVAYIGRDIEDAITLGLIKRSDLPPESTDILGSTNGTIVYTLVTDLIRSSRVTRPGDSPDGKREYIGFSEPVAGALHMLKRFNYEYIYLTPETQKHMELIEKCYSELFDYYLSHLEKGSATELDVDLISDLQETYTRRQPAPARVRDFIAGMTDDYFLQQAEGIGCNVPPKQ